MLSISPVKFYVRLICLLGFMYFQLGTTANAAVIRKAKVEQTHKHSRSKKKYAKKLQQKAKQKLRKKVQETKGINVFVIILISIAILIAGLVLGAVFAIPALWISCLAILVLALVLGGAFLLLMMTASYEC